MFLFLIKIWYFIISTTAALTLLLISFQISVFNLSFYLQQFEANGAYEKFGEERVNAVTENLLSYLRGNQDLNLGFFNQGEQAHLHDVKKVFQGINSLFYIIGGLTLFLLLIFLFKTKDSILQLVRVFRNSVFLILVLSISLLLISPWFPFWFDLLHRPFFPSGTWQFDPAMDKIIFLFPESFFQAISVRIILTWIGLAVLLYLSTWLFGRIFNKFKKI